MLVSVNMLRVTDAEKTTQVDIPHQLAQSSGIFKDMLESNANDGTEPIVLDESPTIFKLFTSWLFHLPDFKITSDNVEALLELSHKYEIPTLANDIGHYAVANKILGPEYAYTLGASFSVPILEKAYPPYVVNSFSSLLLHPEGSKYIKMLTVWCPEKVHPLLKDSLSHLSLAEAAIAKSKEIVINVKHAHDTGNALIATQKLSEAKALSYGATTAISQYEAQKARQSRMV